MKTKPTGSTGLPVKGRVLSVKRERWFDTKPHDGAKSPPEIGGSGRRDTGATQPAPE